MFPDHEELKPARRLRPRRIKVVRPKKSQPPIEYVFMPFMTGSQVYGVPHEASDIDIVLIMTPEKAEEVQQAMLRQNPSFVPQPYGGAIHIKSGCLNLIICTQPALYHMWLRATQEATRIRNEEGPLSKVGAKLLFRTMFREFGADGPEEEPETLAEMQKKLEADVDAIFSSNLI